VDFAAIKANISRPRAGVKLCLRADLFAARDRLVREIAATSGDSLAGGSSELRLKLGALEDEMRAATLEFTFEAVTRATFADIEDAHPSEREGPSTAFMAALVATSLVEPDLTTEQVSELFANLSDGQVQVLEDAAWGVNRETGSVPFSASD
jgi:hypothetical protein